MWWNKSDDARLAVSFVAAYAIRLHGVYSTFGLSENLEQLVYQFSFLLKKQVSLAAVDSWKSLKVWRQSLCWNEKNRPHNLPPAASKKKTKKIKKKPQTGEILFNLFCRIPSLSKF